MRTEYRCGDGRTAGKRMITAVNTNVLIDVLEPDPVHGRGSLDLPRRAMREGSVVACEVV